MIKINQINKNDILDIKVDYLNDRFEGISEFFDVESNRSKKLIIPSSIAGESLKVKVLKAEKNSSVVFCKVMEYIDPVSKKRNFHFNCKNKNCSGCDFSYLNYIAQVETKQSFLKQLFPNYEIFYENENYKELKYRTKINLPIQFDTLLNKFRIGLYKRNSHDIIDFHDNCLVIDDNMNEIISSFRKILNKKSNVTKLLSSNTFLTNLFIRGSKEFGYQVGISYDSKRNKKSKEILDLLLFELSHSFEDVIKSVFTNSNKENKGNSILIDNANYTKTSNSNEFIELKVLNRSYKILPQSFFQLNITTLESLLKDLIYFFKDKIIEINQITDFFSGIGVLSDIFEDIYNDKKCTHKIQRVCIEINDSSFKFVKKDINPKNSFQSFYHTLDMTNTEISMENILGNNNDKTDLFIFDPPRKGVGSESLKTIEKYQPKYIVYLSCNPKSLKKDLDKILEFNQEYKVKFFKGFDMFPQTTHIESLVILELKVEK